MSRKREKPQKPQASVSRKPGTAGHLSQAIIGKRLRLTQDSPLSALSGFSGALTSFDDTDPQHRWRDLDLDNRTLDTMHAADVSDLLCDLSPEVSKALWDFLRMSNPGFEVKALKAGSNPKEQQVDDRAQAALDEWHGHLGDLYGSVDVVINRLFLNAFLRGGFFAELVLDNNGRMPVDLATPDSRHLRWAKASDAQRGPIWKPYQFVNGQKVFLDRPTVRYVPIDPLPGKPQGRSLAAPAFFTVLFAMSLLRDLKRVVMQQGYPRIDITVDLEKLLANTPSDIAGDDAAVAVWVDSIIGRVASEYSMLEPDMAYAHTDVTSLAGPIGAVGSESLGAVDGLLTALDRQAVRALKTTPVMLGMTDGMSEANSNRTYEIYVSGLKALQHLAEGLLGYLDTLALRAQGIQATVQWVFAEVRAAELLRDEQVAGLKLTNAALRHALGFDSLDEACFYATGKEKADQAAPRIPGAGIKAGGGGGGTGTSAPSGAAADAEDGADRLLLSVLGGNGKHAEVER